MLAPKRGCVLKKHPETLFFMTRQRRFLLHERQSSGFSFVYRISTPTACICCAACRFFTNSFSYRTTPLFS